MNEMYYKDEYNNLLICPKDESGNYYTPIINVRIKDLYIDLMQSVMDKVDRYFAVNLNNQTIEDKSKIAKIYLSSIISIISETLPIDFTIEEK